MASRGPFSSSAPPGASTHAAPPGTFLPGTKVQVGTHRVIIDRYLSEGGFAHVYVVHLPRPIDGNQKAVLKRVAVPDKDHLANMRTEVETMKKLRGQNKHIVKYIDSHASQLKNGGYEVFLLMEYCQGGGLIDFMNTRLQTRLTEPEIIKIFTDIAEGVACMHYLKPALLHRDLKVENVLISTTSNAKIFKLCDFGSTAPPRPAAKSAAEARLIEDDIQKHTTLQYRSPEMIDVYRKQPIDEKSDVWALGVFLYKLCYYTTPFEEVGQMAILNAKFKFPGYPRFSDQMKLLIASMLREKPSDRPNIYQILQKSCQLDKRELPIRDIYAHRSQSESRKDQVLPNHPNSSESRVGATLSPEAAKKEAASVPQIEPMRRGRPTKPVSHHGSAKPSPSPLRMMDSTDPFAALDGGKGPVDELSTKFPTLDEFSLMTDRGKHFQFEQRESKPDAADPALAERVTHALADDAFARAPSPVKAQKPAIASKSSTVLEAKKSMERKDLQQRAGIQAAVPQRSAMVSTGTMTSPAHTPPPTKPDALPNRPVWKVPQNEPVRSSSTGQRTAPGQPVETKEKSRLARLLQEDATRSQGQNGEQEPRSPTSSRPSLEGGRPTMKEVDLGLTRSRSLNLRNRPVSVNLGAGPTHIKDREIKHSDYESNFVSAEPEEADTSAVDSEMNRHSAVDFLKELEEEEKGRRGHHKRLSSGSRHGKRTSLPQIAMSGTKLLAGRFGDAFKKFEGGHEHGRRHSNDREQEQQRSPSKDRLNALTPIAGSEATDLSEDRLELLETEDLSPEMRRELEKRQLEAEEKRVASAGAAYKQRLAGSGGASAGASGGQRAATIQNKVHSLLNENARPAQKTATGYGKYTHDRTPQHPPQIERQQPLTKTISNPTPVPPKPASATSAAANYRAQAAISQRPSAPPKPQVLRTGPGSATVSPTIPRQAQTGDALSPDDWETKFNQRYPSLSGIEMVETDIDTSKRPQTKVREV